MNTYLERIEAAEREADAPMWAAFWAAYKPLIPPAPARRPTPREIAEYLKNNPEALTQLFPQAARPELFA